MARPYQMSSQRLKLKAVGHVLLAFLGVIGLLSLFSNHHRIAAPGATQRPPTIGKVTMIYGNHSIYERTLETHKEHSRRLGYPLTVLRNPILHGIWNKLAILQSVVLRKLEKPADQRLQWLFWFDSDTVLMNPNMPLETFLPPLELPNVHLLTSRGWNGLHGGNEYFARSTVYCPLRWFNAYMRHPNGVDLDPKTPLHLQVSPGDLLVHFPGTPKANLTRAVTPYLEIAESQSRDWAIPLEETRFIEETKRFWADLRFGSFGRITSIPEPIGADAAKGN
ncbi:hypothetical protein HCH54_009504 [Aspergillus fumigatus]